LELVPSSRAVEKRQMHRAGLLEARNVEDLRVDRRSRTSRTALGAKLGQSEGSAIVEKPRVRHCEPYPASTCRPEPQALCRLLPVLRVPARQALSLPLPQVLQVLRELWPRRATEPIPL